MSDFFQDAPRLGNQYDADRVLRWLLERKFPADALADVQTDLRRFGDRVVTDLPPLADDAESNPPRLVPFDPWGRRVDEIVTARGWRELDRVSAEEGLVALAYERRHGALSRLHQFAKLYLFSPASATYTCPLAMTDGAARLIEVQRHPTPLDLAFRRLTSRDPEQFWTSGQWMTERTGGSDVGRTSTIARRDETGLYRLHGDKWFTSATTSQMAMTLARIEDEHGLSPPGSRGLSLFYLETRDAMGRLNQILIHRLKDKLGTRALPTAELTLQGTPARLLGKPGDGVREIATLINVTRIHNAICAVATMRRGLALARDFATRREAFGRPLAAHPLHVETLADLQVEFQAAFQLAFRAVELLGREECGAATADESAVLRLLTPLVKLYTARQCVAATSEILESFGGAGYVEDTGLPRLLRDAQVLPIWEGTTNILSLDVLRAIDKQDALAPFLDDIERRLAPISLAQAADEASAVRGAVQRLRSWFPQMLDEGPDAIQAGGRQFAFALARTCAAALLLEQAQWSAKNKDDARDLAAAVRWRTRRLHDLIVPDAGPLADSRALACDEDLPASSRAQSRLATVDD